MLCWAGIRWPQGGHLSAYEERFANISAVPRSAVILIAAFCVLFSPIAHPEGFDQRVTGRVSAWQWVRGLYPLLNLYAFIFLFGGAVYSAIQYFAIEKGRTRFLGNILIALVRFCRALAEPLPGSTTWRSYITELYTYVKDISSLNIGPKP